MGDGGHGIVKSPQAERMLGMVTRGFYDGSHVAQWMFEAIGREFDEMAAWARGLRDEVFPQSCTWSIGIWEWLYGFDPDDSLPLGFRRGRVLSRVFQASPLNPARLEAILSAATGVPVAVTENVAPYAIKVTMDESDSAVSDRSAALKLLRSVKPAHISFVCETVIVQERAAGEWHCGAMAELIHERLSVETELPAYAESYWAAAASEYRRETICEEADMACAYAESYEAAIVSEYRHETVRGQEEGLA